MANSNLFETQSTAGRVSCSTDSLAHHAAAAFLWEWFTTKPYVDSGEVRFIGSVLSE